MAKTTTTPTDEVDTSTNEDVKDDASVEDFGDEGFEAGEEVPDKKFDKDGNELPAGDEDTTESSEESEADESDTKEEEAADSEESADQADEVDETVDKPDEETSTEEESADDKAGETTSLSSEEQKRHNEEMAKSRIAERKARERVEKAQKDADEATIERYLREAGDDELELEQRKLNVEAFRVQQEKITVNEDRLQAGLEKAVANIPLFRSGSQAAIDELYAAADDFEKMYVRKNDTGRPIEVTGDVFTYLQSKAKSIQRIQASGATQQERSKSKQKSKTTTLPVKAPAKKKTDEGLDAFDEEAGRY